MRYSLDAKIQRRIEAESAMAGPQAKFGAGSRIAEAEEPVAQCRLAISFIGIER
jgi:hypothetical protein